MKNEWMVTRWENVDGGGLNLLYNFRRDDPVHVAMCTNNFTPVKKYDLTLHQESLLKEAT